MAIKMAERVRNYCQARMDSHYVIQHVPLYVQQHIDPSRGVHGAYSAWSILRDDCDLLIARLRAVRPLVIDYFLGWNRKLQAIGKLIIAAVILECEANELKSDWNRNRKLQLEESPTKSQVSTDFSKYRDRWYRFLTHKIASGCVQSSDLCKNDVNFITFNYDCSLEHHLSRALQNIDIFEDADVTSFMKGDRILHVYGQMRSPSLAMGDPDAVKEGYDWLSGSPHSDFSKFLNSPTHFLDESFKASQGLRTIDPFDKMDEAVLASIQTKLVNASVIYILGFGFDENNSKRIGLNELFVSTDRISKSVMFTNMGDSNAVNKRAGFSLLGKPDAFLSGQSGILSSTTKSHIEKSTRNVYDALELDFDAVETRPPLTAARGFFS